MVPGSRFSDLHPFVSFREERALPELTPRLVGFTPGLERRSAAAMEPAAMDAEHAGPQR